MLMRRSNGKVDGFIVEGPTAGGHNAPPRGNLTRNERGEPVYGERDLADFEKMRELDVPFWIAGGRGSPAGLRAALDVGAAGIQVGTLFAYTDESGLDPCHKRAVLAQAARGVVDVYTDGRASPTGYPFKVVRLRGSNSEEENYVARRRVCDAGYLRVPYRTATGRLDYRCSGEPVRTYVKKGGGVEDTVGRKCLCNALLANIGQGQVRAGGAVELPILTSGDDLRRIGEFTRGRTSYTALDVLQYLMDGLDEGHPASVPDRTRRLLGPSPPPRLRRAPTARGGETPRAAAPPQSWP